MDVTVDNFESALVSFSSKLSTCSFLSIDTEFTAHSRSSTPSLFDFGKERYEQLRCSSRLGIVNQMGVALFTYEKKSQSYMSHVFNFNVCRRGFGKLVSEEFVVQADSLVFLVDHGFDLNKMATKGIGYLDESEYTRVSQRLSSQRDYKTLYAVSFEEQDLLDNSCSLLAEWLANEKPSVGDCKVLDCDLKRIKPWLLHNEVRRRFNNLWTHSEEREEERRVVARLVSPSDRCRLEDNVDEVLQDELLTDLLGVSRVLKLIMEAKKPLVGHNCWLDLIKLYAQFIDQVPQSLEDFKACITSSFPLVFDTKRMTFDIEHLLIQNESELSGLLNSSNLQSLFKSLHSVNVPKFFWPPVKIPEDESFQRYQLDDASQQRGWFHEAGYDAFVTGRCFLRLAHLAASSNYLSEKTMRLLNFSEHLSSVTHLANKLHPGRISIPYLRLDGQDPSSNRPTWLLLEGKSLTLHKVNSLLAPIGKIDMRVFGKGKNSIFLLAPSSLREYEGIKRLCGGRGNTYRVTEWIEYKRKRRNFYAILFSFALTAFVGGGALTLFLLRKN